MEIVTKPTLSPAFPVPSATRLFSTAPECECAQHSQQAYTTHNKHRQRVVASLCCHQVDFVALRCCRRVVAFLSSFSSSSVVLFPLSFPSPHSLSSPFSCQQCSTREHERVREGEREGKWCMCLWWWCGMLCLCVMGGVWCRVAFFFFFASRVCIQKRPLLCLANRPRVSKHAGVLVAHTRRLDLTHGAYSGRHHFVFSARRKTKKRNTRPSHTHINTNRTQPTGNSE